MKVKKRKLSGQNTLQSVNIRYDDRWRNTMPAEGGHNLPDDRETINRKNIFIDYSYVSYKSYAQYIIIPRP
jgi:hypothetical protein